MKSSIKYIDLRISAITSYNDIWRRILRISWHFLTLALHNFLSIYWKWKFWNFYHKLWHYLGLFWRHTSVFILIHRCAILKWIVKNMHLARREQFSFLGLSNGGWDSKVDIIFNKMFELNTINDKDFKIFNARCLSMYKFKFC